MRIENWKLRIGPLAEPRGITPTRIALQWSNSKFSILNSQLSIVQRARVSSQLKNYGYCCFSKNGPPTRRDEGAYPSRGRGMTEEQRSHRAVFGETLRAQSLFENYEGSCGKGFCLWPRRRGPSIPAAGCKARANEGHRQKTCRPEGFRGKARLASLLLGQRPLAGILPRRASPSVLFLENRTPRSFQTGSEALLPWFFVARRSQIHEGYARSSLREPDQNISQQQWP